MSERIESIDSRLGVCEKRDADFDALLASLDKLLHRLKHWGGIIVTAAIASGMFGEQWEKFLSAVLNG